MNQNLDDSYDDWEYTPKGISNEDFEENLEFMKNHPLFMKDLPKDYEKNEDVVALQNLIYDEEPVQIARNLNVNQPKFCITKTDRKKPKEYSLEEHIVTILKRL